MAVSGENLIRPPKRVSRRLFPHFLIRTGGLPADGLRFMRAKETVERLREMTALSRRLSEENGELIEAVEREVPQVRSDSLRNALIRFKRDLYNGRKPKVRVTEEWAELTPELAQRIRLRLQNEERLVKLREEARTRFEEELLDARRHLRQTVTDPRLLAGIALTSQELHEKAVKYIETPVERQKSRLRKVETSLVKFVTRASVKTSPFSTFTAVGTGSWDERAEHAPFTLPSPNHRVFTELNHANLLRVMEGLCAHPEVRVQLRYRINPTLIIDQGRVKYIRRTDDSKLRPRVFKTLETPVSLDANPAIRLVLSRFGDASELSYAELIRRLTEAGQFPAEQLRAFVNQLISLQVLVPVLPRHEQNPDLAGWLIRWLESLDGDIPKTARDHLIRIRELAEAAPDDTPETRSRRLRDIRNEFHALRKSVGFELSDESLALLLFEDAILEEEARMNPSAWERHLDDLFAWQRLLPVLDVKFRIQSKIAAQFVEMYGENGICDRPGRFLSQVITSITDYFRSMLPSNMMKDTELHNDVENVRRLNELKRELGKLIAEKLRSSEEEAFLSREEIERLTERIPAQVQHRFLTNDAFVQPALADGKPLWVLNHLYVGNGTFFTRFLPWFREELTQRLREELRELVHPRTLAELSGVFGFNANLRPRLAPFELDLPMLPPARDGLGPDEVISWEDVILKYDKREDRVKVVHPKHGDLAVLFAGTLIPALLPFVVNFLVTQFTCGNMPENLFLFAEEELSPDERQKIRIWPRLRVGDVVLSRKKWVIPRGHLPKREPNDSDFDWFERVHRWKEEIGFPDRIFVRFIPLDDSENPFGEDREPSDASRNFDFTDWKPQWIDFQNPLTVKLLGKMIAEQPTGMIAEEMLPDLEHLATDPDDHKRVNEWVIELSQVPEVE
ncbi:lantibiotic dehydratase [Staphylospora marina]|uniref:lantibiotic dehydratase n=1 Tax=Staphylospora marina TaxID=2490858 RepID=UPI0013DD9433|nr:lantibiotic dehydratase [Staphylospora marina]